MEKNYKFIVCGPEADYYNVMLADVNSSVNSIYVPNTIFENVVDKIVQKLIGILFKYARTGKVDRVLCKYLLLKLMPHIDSIAGAKDNICLIFFRTPIYTRGVDARFEQYLQKIYPNASVVVYCADFVDKYKTTTIDVLKEKSSIVLVYDVGEAKKYQLTFLPLPYSSLNYESSVQRKSVYFGGAAKDRFQDILKVYKKLTRDGYFCAFYIQGVPEAERIVLEGMNYIDEYMSYKTYLELASKCEYILELVQGNSTGRTLRVGEAIRLKKYLISNNCCMLNDPIYNASNMEVFKNCEEINLERFAERECEYTSSQVEALEVDYFFKQIEEKLKGK